MIFLKKKHVIPKQRGGSPIWEKFPHFPVVFFGSVPNENGEKDDNNDDDDHEIDDDDDDVHLPSPIAERG